MKEGWKVVKLGEVANIVGGSTPKTNIKSYWNGGHYWVTPAELHGEKYINKTERSITEEAIAKTNLTLLPKGTVLLSSRAPIGKVSITQVPMYCNQGFKNIVCFENLFNEYVYYYLIAKVDYLNSLGTGATFKEISKRVVESVEIPLPSLSEQQRIVGILDAAFVKIDALKANAEKNLENAKALFQQVLAKEMEPKEGWEEKKLGEVYDTSAGGTPLKTSKEYYEGGNIPWIRSGEVCKKHITESEMFITEAGLSNSSAKLFPPHTVLVAMYGATAGQVGILDFESSTNQAVCGILPNDQYLPDYLYYYLLSYKDRLVATAVGNAQPNISQQKIKAIPLPLIKIKTQQEIVNAIERLDAKCRLLEEVAQKTIAECDALKQSILRQAFNGEL